MIIYISIPMSGKDMKVQERIADYWSTYFRGQGHRVINPFELATFLEAIHTWRKWKPPTYSDYLTYDLMRIPACTHIFLCVGWENSNGCLTEVEAAMKHRITYLFERNFKVE